MFDFEEKGVTAIADEQIREPFANSGERIDGCASRPQGVHNLVMIRIDTSRSAHSAC